MGTRFQDQVFDVPGMGQVFYAVHVPEHASGVAGLPMLVSLHGSGERGHDYARLKIHGIPKCIEAGQNIPAIVLCPQCPEGIVWGHLAFALRDLIVQVAAEHAVDMRRIALTGLSMGGFGTWDMAMTFPALFRRIAPICGGGMSWRADALLGVPVWAFHGEKDEAVPPVYSALMVEAVNRAGGNARLTVFPGVGHNAWEIAYQTTDVIQWLLAP